MNVHFLEEPDQLDALRSRLDPSIKLTVGEPVSPADYEILVAGRPTAEHLTASPRLDSLLIPFAGLPTSTHQLMQAFPHIGVYNLHHNAASTAEMAIALLMSVAKNIIPADQAFRQHDWTPRHAPMPQLLLHGKTVLILGYGAIGQRVAMVCEAMGMQVIGIKREMDANANYPHPVYTPDKLPNLLPKVTAMVVCLPLTDQTRGMIGAAELALLPNNAVIVNVGRATVIDESSLYEALKNRAISGAAFDVWYRYPDDEASRTNSPPAHYPFHELPNMVMSPHRAGGLGTDDMEITRVTALADVLNTAARGEPMPYRVDLSKGY